MLGRALVSLSSLIPPSLVRVILYVLLYTLQFASLIFALFSSATSFYTQRARPLTSPAVECPFISLHHNLPTFFLTDGYWICPEFLVIQTVLQRPSLYMSPRIPEPLDFFFPQSRI